MGNSEEKRLPDKGLSDLSFSGYVLTLMRIAITHTTESLM
jgi:hypothetical protein